MSLRHLSYKNRHCPAERLHKIGFLELPALMSAGDVLKQTPRLHGERQARLLTSERRSSACEHH